MKQMSYMINQRYMKKLTCCFVCIFLLIGTVAAQDKEVKLKIVQTSDIHGNFYPRDFILQRDAVGSLARVYAFVQKERETYKDNLILLDNGDILQGQPTAYYYNYIDTVSPHVAAEMLNFMGYNAGNMGNHDVETGRAVFDRWAGDCHAPVLGANIIETATGKTHFPPYVTLERDGVRIVVLGMITPAIPVWLSENLWKGLRFDDMEETARKWMKIIREKERPDIVIGMFHAGQDALLMGGKYRENASLDVARNVPGFDIVLMGHDHARECKKVRNIAGDSVLVIDPASNGVVVSDIDITVTLCDGKVTDKKIDGVLTETGAYGVSDEFMKHFDTLGDEVCLHAKAAVVVGETAQRIAAAIRASKCYDPGKLPLVEAPDFRAAVETAYGLAQPGDIVTLSPSCSSFDFFKNFEERGNTFRAIVESLQ